MPNGIVLFVKVHPGDWVYHIKEAVLEKATTDGKDHLESCGENFRYPDYLVIQCLVWRIGLLHSVWLIWDRL